MAYSILLKVLILLGVAKPSGELLGDLDRPVLTVDDASFTLVLKK